MVLGNHEIHLLGVAFGVREENPGDTIREILRAKNGGELISWLATQRIVHHEGNRLMVHGGFSPHWTLDQSLDLSTRIEAILRGPRCSEFIGYCYGKDNSPCDQDWPELKSAIRTFTTIRTCSEDGTVNRNFAGPLSELPKGFFPWYQLADPTIARQKVYFGHWAAHGYKQIDNFTCLDSGCVWERELTAVRLADDCPINVKNCDI
jgi:bis(5'-nucleosyl)-tetraphosphatase (symmetrical)